MKLCQLKLILPVVGGCWGAPLSPQCVQDVLYKMSAHGFTWSDSYIIRLSSSEEGVGSSFCHFSAYRTFHDLSVGHDARFFEVMFLKCYCKLVVTVLTILAIIILVTLRVIVLRVV